MVAITPNVPERSLELIAERKLTFPLLRDEGNAYADTLGLRYTLPDDLKALYLQFGIDLAASNGESSGSLPLPARYLVARDGTIVYARVAADYTRRPEPEETLAALQALTD